MRLYASIAFIALISMLLVFAPCSPSFAGSGRTMSSEQWQRLTTDKAFDYRNDKEHAKAPEIKQPGVLEKVLMSLFSFFGHGGGYVLLWIVVIGVGLYVAYVLFLKKDSVLFARRARRMKEEPEDENTEDIAATNWNLLLQNAAAAGDARLAVRYSYMWLLQLMQQRNLIQYRNDKTNHEYYHELKDSNYKQPFRQLSRQYEYSWYGGYQLPDTDYGAYMQLFNDVKKQLGA